MKRKASTKEEVKEESEDEIKEEINDEVMEEPDNSEKETSDNDEAELMESTSEEKNEEKTEADNPNLFKVLGKPDMHNLEALKITSAWVSNATTFSATIDKTTSEKLETIDLPEYLKENVPDGIANWFPVQYSVLPTLLNEIRRPPAVRPRDVAIAAPTGSGKTICYVLPVLAAVGTKKSNFLHAIVLVPVQTLATQIVEEFARWNKAGHAKVVCLSGANEFEKEARNLASDPPNIIVATPVRLIQHLTSKLPPKVPNDMKKLRYLIVDEADRMGKLMREEWLELVEYLCGGMERVACLDDVIRQRRAPQKIVLSATLSKDIEELHLWNLFRPRFFAASATKSKEVSKEINHVSGSVALASSISHRLVVCDSKYHPLAVYKQLCLNQFNRTIIFVNEADSSNRLAHVLKQLCSGKFEVDYMSAKMFGKRRYTMLQRFNSNSNRVLICSDVLARGTDLNMVDCVINYNLPADDKLFVHRAGRTGRAGRAGSVISVGDKDTKRLFIKMLKVTSLWGDSIEEVMEEYQFEKDMPSYSKAIESLKSLVETNGDTRAAKRSGFEAKRKSRPTKNGEKPWLKNKNQNSSQK